MKSERKKFVRQQMVTSSNVKLKLHKTLRRALFNLSCHIHWPIKVSLSHSLSLSHSQTRVTFPSKDFNSLANSQFTCKNLTLSTPMYAMYHINVCMYILSVCVILEEFNFIRKRQIEFCFHFY